MYQSTVTFAIITKRKKTIERIKRSQDLGLLFFTTPDNQIVKRGEHFFLPLISVATSSKDLELAVAKISKAILSIKADVLLQRLKGGRCVMEFTITNDDSNNPFPAITIMPEVLISCNRLGSSIVFNMITNEKEATGAYRQGVYLDIDAKNQGHCVFDTEEITGLAGVRPTLILEKGKMGHYNKLVETDCWELAIDEVDKPLLTAIRGMMGAIKRPKDLGLYCKRKGLCTHIDIGYYGLSSHHETFAIPHEFISFCCKLNIEWIDIDIIA